MKGAGAESVSRKGRLEGLSAGLVRGRTDIVATGPRQETGGLFLRVDAIPFRRVSKCPKEVDRDKGGYFETSLGVSKGMP